MEDIVKVYDFSSHLLPIMIMPREEAINWFLECIMFSEGSERDRYCNCLTDIMLGRDEVCLYTV